MKSDLWNLLHCSMDSKNVVVDKRAERTCGKTTQSISSLKRNCANNNELLVSGLFHQSSNPVVAGLNSTCWLTLELTIFEKDGGWPRLIQNSRVAWTSCALKTLIAGWHDGLWWTTMDVLHPSQKERQPLIIEITVLIIFMRFAWEIVVSTCQDPNSSEGTTERGRILAHIYRIVMCSAYARGDLFEAAHRTHRIRTLALLECRTKIFWPNRARLNRHVSLCPRIFDHFAY